MSKLDDLPSEGVKNTRQTMPLLSEDNSSGGEEVVQVGDPKDITFDPSEATLEYVVVVPLELFLMQKQRGENKAVLSGLKLIKEVDIAGIKVGALRSFCVNSPIIIQCWKFCC